MKNIKFLVLPIAMVILVGCNLFQESVNNNDSIINNDNRQEKVAKIVETEGRVISKEISLFGGGTHVLVDEDGDILYALESKVEDLSKYEKENVKIRGELKEKRNENEEDLLSILTIETTKKPEELTPKKYILTKKGFSITLPGNWQKEEKDGVYFFYPEDTDPVISIESFLLKSESGKKAQDSMKEATDVTIAGKKAFRVVDGDVVDIFIVNNNQEVLLFHFTPQEEEIEEKLVFLEMLTTLKWLDEDQEPEVIEEPEENEKCGGEESKLCPIGFRCELESTEDGSEGLCVSIDQEVKKEITPETENTNVEVLDEEESEEQEIACLMDVKMCPDGSSVARDPDDNCNFPDCPTVVSEEEASDDLTEDETRIVKPPLNEYYNIENKYFNFTVDVPRNYFWQHFGPTSDALSVTGFSDIEMETVDDAVIKLEVVKGAAKNNVESTAGENMMIFVPRDENSKFKVSGNAEYKDVLLHIANSIVIIEEDVQE